MRHAVGGQTSPVQHGGARLLRMDAHCHSSASSGPAVEALGLIGCPECYSTPEQVYDRAKAQGMDLVAITDHDTIDGAMSLVERGFKDVVVGEEVTVHFPEDHCKLHVLVWMLTPDLHEQLDRFKMRDDVYLFAKWLRLNNLPHSLAHPLYIQNRKLTARHVDRCALLFKGFEVLNGAHSGTHRTALDAYLRALTPGKVHRLIEEHALEPLWPRIWEKATTGGSDDHGLLNVGRAWTSVSIPAGTKECQVQEAFFREVMSARAQPGGVAGHSSLLAHQLTSVAANYSADRIFPSATPTGRYVAHKVLRFAGVSFKKPSTLSLGLHLLKGKLVRRRRRLSPLIDALRQTFTGTLARYPDLASRLTPEAWAAGSAMGEHDRLAGFYDDLYAAMHAVLGSSALKAARKKDTRGIIDHVASYLLLELTQLPYLFSLFHQNKERPFVEQLVHESSQPGDGPLDRPLRVLLFTDTLGDVNGVSRFIRNAAATARATGRDLRIITSTNFAVPDESNIVNVPPVFATRMPKYENLEIALPPLVKMLRVADAFQPDVIHISTPGPVGLVGHIAARMLRVPVVGVYHTDFPAYVEHLFKDDSLAHFCRAYMRFFYSSFRTIFARSTDYIERLASLGLSKDRCVPLQPGIVTAQFGPSFRDEDAMNRLCGGPPGPVRILYVGRVSVEKNLPLLTRVWKKAGERLAAMGVSAQLVIVGDGPYRAQMEKELSGTHVSFLGFRYDKELAMCYASSDLFVFPSTTDTLGQVVMESQASGLPVIVTDKGGPKEIVRDGITGNVVPDDDVDQWVNTVIQLTIDGEKRRAMGQAAHRFMQDYSMTRSFDHFWNVHEAARAAALAERGILARTEPAPARAPAEPDWAQPPLMSHAAD